jgi:tRNA U34 5-carboxymethylaminomethyl modifying enzyme MnmG/GidA
MKWVFIRVGNADANALQWRLLNRSKGLAVRSPHAQSDQYSG